jgi:hypothetical protein
MGLKPLSILWGSEQFSRMKIPEANFWSPSVVQKPKEWDSHISIVGYSFPESKVGYTPPDSLVHFLEEGDQPIYIGFGSCTDDSQHLTKIITQAVRNAGVRAIISRGWAKLGSTISGTNSIYVVDDLPHTFLFSRVRAIIQHGGAGTTAAGFRAGKPMLVIPFVADMTFWGMLVHKHGIGPMPINRDQLTTENFTKGIEELLRPAHLRCAEDMARKLALEPDGAESAVGIFNQIMNDKQSNERMCDFLLNRRAIWKVNCGGRMGAHFSTLAACVLVQEEKLAWSNLHRIQRVRYRWTGPNSGFLGVLRFLLLLVFWAFNSLLVTIQFVSRPMSWGEEAKRRRTLNAKIEKQLRKARICQGDFEHGVLDGEEKELVRETILDSWDKSGG